MQERAGGPKRPPVCGTGRETDVSRRSPAHQRMPEEQRSAGGPGRSEASDDRHGRQVVYLSAAPQCPHPECDRGRDAAYGAADTQGGQDCSVGPVQQQDQRGRDQHMGGRHPGREVTPAVCVHRRHGRMSGCPERGVVCRGGCHRARLAPGRQRNVQCALHGEGASEAGAEGKAPARNGPDHGELCHRQQCHEPPGHRPLGDSVVPQGGQHTAGQSEHPCPYRSHGTARPRLTLAASVGCPALALSDRPSFRHDSPVGCRRASRGYGGAVDRVQQTRDSAGPDGAPLTGFA